MCLLWWGFDTSPEGNIKIVPISAILLHVMWANVFKMYGNDIIFTKI